MAQRLRIIGGHILSGHVCHEHSLTPSSVAAAKPQVVVITGCTSGLGLNLAQEFIRLGHTVAGCGRRATIIDSLNAEHAKSNSSFHIVDVSKAAEVAAFAREVEKRYGDVDVLICNAGLGGQGKFSWDISEEHIHNIVDVSLKGLMFSNKYFLPIMIKGLDNGAADGPVKRIVNISSGVAHTTIPGAADYCSVKFAVEGWSKCVAQEIKYLGDKVKPNFKDRMLCVPLAPGWVRTEMNVQEKAPSAEVWCKDAAAFILQIPPSDNGSSLAMPGYYSEAYKEAWIVPSGAKMNGLIRPPS